MAIIIDGKKISLHMKQHMAEQIQQIKTEKGIIPGLAVVIVGEDPASHVYVRNKEKACKEVGIYSEVYRLEASCPQQELISLIERLNIQKNIHGILVQLPLPSHLDEKAVIEKINPWKDVDAFHEINVGKIMTGDYRFLPCTPAGIMKLLEFEGIPVSGKHCVVLGRSNIVGKPMALLLLHHNATVTICHSKTCNLRGFTKQADILICAVGKANFVTSNMVKQGAVVIDVGINRNEQGKLCGDVEFSSVEPLASYITPVPGGVGPMTISMLLQNTLTAALLQN